MTEQEAANFVAWVRANHPSLDARVRDFYAADGTFTARYVETRGRHGRLQLWDSKEALADGLQLSRQVFWAALFMVATGGFLVGARNMPSLIAGVGCILVGTAGIVRMVWWPFRSHSPTAKP